MSNELAWMNSAAKAIAKVGTVGEAKEYADKAAAVRVFAQKQNWSREQRNQIAEIEIRAARRMGELLVEMPTLKPGNPSAREGLKLKDMGVSEKQSYNAQRLARIPNDVVEQYIATNKLADRLSVRGLVRQMKQAEAVAVPEESQSATTDSINDMISRGMKFGTIYGDPPWQYGNQGTRAATDNHYGTMAKDEIASLPIGELAADECHLHLWTTNGFLKDALELIETWGFEFKSTFVWVKPQLGIGNYWRCSHEIMLLGVKGGLTFPPSNIKSWAEFPRKKHSAKPNEVRKLIERVSPGPRLELFSRTICDGWVSWGNQIDRGMFDGDVPHI
jgi:N6-adenosine-specific RNA methylase IME4